jgi:SAM-dependent methyltransferase
MSHLQQLRFVSLVDEMFLPTTKASMQILEVGSYDVNGSIRRLFADSKYTGVDLCEGPGVDLVCSGDELTFADESFDLALSMECFEHNPHWRETFINMHRMTRNNGVIIVTCASQGRFEHGTSRTSPSGSPGTHSLGSEYYRNLLPCDFEALGLAGLFTRWHLCRIGTDLYFVGWKGDGPSDLSEFGRRLPSIREHVPLRLKLFYLPVTTAAALLPNDRFQSFALGYLKHTESIRSFGRRLLRLNAS